MKLKDIKTQTLVHKFKHIFFIALGTLIFILLAMFITFLWNKDKISSSLLIATNNLTQGEVTFDRVSLNLLAQFPNVSVTLSNVTYFEKKQEYRSLLTTPIATIESIYGGIDLFELAKGKISINSIHIKNGDINLIAYSDSTLNLLNAIKKVPQNGTKAKQKTENTNENLSDSSQHLNVNLILEEIKFETIALNYTNKFSNNSTSIIIDNAVSSLEIDENNILAAVNAQILLKKIPLANLTHINSLPISIQSSINYNKIKKHLQLNKSSVKIIDALFTTQGSVLMGEEKNIDLVFDGSDADWHLFSLFLNPVGIENLKSGKIYFSGEAKGSYKNRIPVVKCNFGISNMTLTIPKTDSSIRNLELKGSFNSGSCPDMSQAQLKIDTLSALLPNGFVYSSFSLQNFTNPKLRYAIDLKTNINGFESVFNLNKIENLKGNINISSEFKGEINTKKASVTKTASNTHIAFDSVGFNIADLMHFENINGSISGNFDTLCIDNLSALIGNSDFMVDGKVYNSLNLLTKANSEIVAKLNIAAKLIDLADLLRFIPDVGSNFPYQITDFESRISATTTCDQLSYGDTSARFTIENHKIKLTINEMLPPLNLHKGTFVFGHDSEGLLLRFNNINVSFLDGNLNTSLIFHNPYDSNSYVNFSTNLTDFNAGKLLFYKSDTVPKSLDALINGNLDGKLSFSDNKNIMFNKVALEANNFLYKTDSNVYTAKNIRLHTKNTSYNTHNKQNPLATLNATMELAITDLASKNIKLNQAAFAITAKNGAYFINTISSNLLGNETKGRLFITPFTIPIKLMLKYDIKHLDAKTLMASFSKDEFIDGNLNFSMNIEGAFENYDSALNKLNGNLELTGDSLMLIGINIDDFLKKVEKTQTFNMVDLGAFMVAGPLGLIATKGTSATRLFFNDRNSKTDIIQFKSGLAIDKGLLSVSDMAFSTNQNRIASKGWLNINSKNMLLEIAVVDSKGCRKISQKLSGPISKPEISELKVISSLLAPVTNLISDIVNSDCEAFYTGEVKHPESTNK